MKRLLQASKRGAAILALLVASGTAAYADIPAPPQNLAIDVVYPENPIEPYTASLTWSASTDADGYRVYVKTLGEEWQGGEFEFLAETQDTYLSLETRLEIVSGAYAFFVSAYNDDGDSPASNVVSSACGREWNDGDLSEYNGTGITTIVTTPDTDTRENSEYRYDVNTFAEYSANPMGSVEYDVDGPAGMAIDPATGVITWTPRAAGSYIVTVTATEKSSSKYDQQMWQLEVEADGVTGVEDNNANASVSVYPNPTASNLTVAFTATAGKTSLVISDANGTEMMKYSLTAIDGVNTASLNVESLASGRYFLRIISASNTTVLPLAIVR